MPTPDDTPPETPRRASWRERLRIIIFEADTPVGKFFDIGLLLTIGVSVAAVMLESVTSIRQEYGAQLRVLEWAITAAFTVEYVLRLSCVEHPLRYARSFFGIVDLLSLLPSYLSLILPGSQSLLVVRALRLIRIFRIFKLSRFLGEANVLRTAVLASTRKVLVFIGTVLLIVTIVGSAMFVIEGPEHGFTSIPHSMYWAIVTMTTVGYGDIAPQTVYGRLLASVVMLMGYGIIAIPTGIVTAEIVESAAAARKVTTRCCPRCMAEGHDSDARYCKACGAELEQPADPA
jgi:voltage-gated potassium channel